MRKLFTPLIAIAAVIFLTAPIIIARAPFESTMGRCVRELSPMIVDVNDWAATTPESRRIVVPEFPASSG